MKDETIKRIQALSRASPSLSEEIGAKLTELCGERVDFIGVLLTENSKGAMLVTTMAMIDEKKMDSALGYLAEAIALHAGGNAPPSAEAYSSIKKIEDKT